VSFIAMTKGQAPRTFIVGAEAIVTDRMAGATVKFLSAWWWYWRQPIGVLDGRVLRVGLRVAYELARNERWFARQPAFCGTWVADSDGSP
jgi:hypothetical protein